jgi:hypothetical protein
MSESLPPLESQHEPSSVAARAAPGRSRAVRDAGIEHRRTSEEGAGDAAPEEGLSRTASGFGDRPYGTPRIRPRLVSAWNLFSRLDVLSRNQHGHGNARQQGDLDAQHDQGVVFDHEKTRARRGAVERGSDRMRISAAEMVLARPFSSSPQSAREGWTRCSISFLATSLDLRRRTSRSRSRSE